MFELVVMVCLAANGGDCREFKIPHKEYKDVVVCITDSQAEGAAWQRENTKYTIVGTRCAKDAEIPDAPTAQ